jgi:hypothetical protein
LIRVTAAAKLLRRRIAGRQAGVSVAGWRRGGEVSPDGALPTQIQALWAPYGSWWAGRGWSWAASGGQGRWPERGIVAVAALVLQHPDGGFTRTG